MPKSAIQNVLEKFTAFTRNGERLGSIATMFLTFMIVADITMRRFFSSPFSFSFEVVQFTLVICAYGYIAYTTSVARHISVETLTVKFSTAARKWLRTVGDCLTIILLGLISWQHIVKGITGLDLGTTSAVLRIPEYPFRFFAALGAAVACIILLLRVIDAVRNGGEAWTSQ